MADQLETNAGTIQATENTPKMRTMIKKGKIKTSTNEIIVKEHTS